MTRIMISTDKKLLDVDYIHAFLSTTYWAKDIPRALVLKSIEHSFCFGMFKGDEQIGFARVITDFTTFAYLADVFIDPRQRNKGLGTMLIEAIMGNEQLGGLRRWHLITRDAQPLYRPFGFSSPECPEQHMEKRLHVKYQS